MNNWLFNEALDFPYCVIHPFAIKEVNKIKDYIYPDYIASIKLHGGALQKWYDDYSDIDLCVLVDEDDEDLKDDAYSYVNTLCRSLGIRPDILVEDIETYNMYKTDFDSVEQEIEETGVYLWQRPN